MKQELKKQISKINQGEISEVPSLIRKYYMGQFPSESEFINALLAFDKYYVVKGFMKELELSQAVAGQFLHAADHSNGAV